MARRERPGSAPEEWWSVIEIDDRRAYFWSAVLGARTREDLSEDLEAHLRRTIEDLLASPWVEALSLDTLRELGHLPFWSWERMAWNLGEEVDVVSVVDLVKHHLYDEMSDLLDEPGAYISQALFTGPDALTDHVNALRETASKYEIHLESLWEDSS